MVVHSKIWRSLYRDSVVLMQVASRVRKRDGVEEAAAFMGTAGNLALLREISLATPEAEAARANDLIFVVRAEHDGAAQEALAAAAELLSGQPAGGSDDEEETPRPRSVEFALRGMPSANLAVVSVPGAFAAYEAQRALRLGLHVFLFSDNVPLEDEIALKRMAATRGLLCMGPDCGTAYLAGRGIGFFNVVPRGRIGCISASGTGLQAVAARVGNRGEGISHGIGVGGRDLSGAVGGAMALAALDALAADDGTEVIVLISKPPHPEVMAKVEAAIARVGKPVVVCCLGAAARPGAGAAWAATLDQAADMAVAAARGETWKEPVPTVVDDALARLRTAMDGRFPAAPGMLGLFTGGTLAHEAHLLAEHALGPVAFNGAMEDRTVRHRIIDLGDDRYTVGRPHPMIAPEIRGEMVESAAARDDIGILLFDLVLGRGAHDDPATPLAEAFTRARARAEREHRGLVGIASVVGTALDPQGMAAQTACLEKAGILVMATNADATRLAFGLARTIQTSER